MRRVIILYSAGLALIAGVAILAIVFVGLYNVSAAVGHWPGVSWVLHTTFVNSVKLRAPSLQQTPDLSAPGMSALGARHYDSACRTCHGAPGVMRSATIRAMVPQPPPIASAVADWSPEELFWIISNGAKMTGMPAWPSKVRDSDVWPLVAFLREVAAMPPQVYLEMTRPPPLAEGKRGDPLVTYCAICHGSDGRGRDNPQVPRLNLLSAAYIDGALRAYRDGMRHGGIMQHAASGLSDVQIALLADYFAAAIPRATSAAATATRGRGAQIALGLGTAPDTPVCAACHGPWQAPLPPENPALGGQTYPYLLEQMRLWKAGKRGGSVRAELMHKVMPSLADEDLQDLAKFYADFE